MPWCLELTLCHSGNSTCTCETCLDVWSWHYVTQRTWWCVVDVPTFHCLYVCVCVCVCTSLCMSVCPSVCVCVCVCVGVKRYFTFNVGCSIQRLTDRFDSCWHLSSYHTSQRDGPSCWADATARRVVSCVAVTSLQWILPHSAVLLHSYSCEDKFVQ